MPLWRSVVAARVGPSWPHPAMPGLSSNSFRKLIPMLATAAAIRCTVTAWQAAARMSTAERAESVAEPQETGDAAAASMTAAFGAEDDAGEPN